MSRFWSPVVQNLDPYVPGEQLNKKEIIKLNTNENPYEPSLAAQQVIKKASDGRLRLYPGPESSGIKKAVARWLNVKPSQIFIGNGSDEVLAHLFKGFFTEKNSPLLFPDITYSFYPVYCGLFNISFKKVPLNADFTINVHDYTQNNRGIILANPNAPTGILLPLKQVEQIVKNNPDSVVVIDEAYIDFAGGFGKNSAVNLIDSYENLLVVRTLSKSFALAGLRVGFALGQEHLIQGLSRVKNCFNSYPLDRLAQAGAEAAIDDTAYFKEIVTKIVAGRKLLTERLSDLEFKILPSSANFIFATHKLKKAALLAAELKERSILVRHFKDEKIDNYLRITVGTTVQIELLTTALKEILEG